MALGGLDARLLTVVIKAQNDTKAAFAEVGAQLEGLKRASGGGGFLGLGGPAAIATAVGIGAIVAAVGTAAVATKWASDFKTELTALVTGAGEAANAIPLISKGVLAMAGEVGQTPVNLAKGLFMIESAGYHGAGGLKVLQAAAEGAKVGNADMMVTADAVTTVMKDYHLGVGQAADATNFLIGVVKQGKTHMEDLAGSLSGILPIASALHIPLDQVGGAMATLTARGVPAANAATYLRFTISALAGETPKGKKALESIGLTSIEVGNTLTTQGLLPALQLIQDHLTKKFPDGGAAMFATLKDITGGTRGLGAALQLTGGNLADFEAATKTVSDQITGANGKILGWDQVQKDFGFQMDRSKASVVAMGTQLGEKLLPAVTAVAQWFNDSLIPAIHNFADFYGSKIAPLIAFAAQTAWPVLQKALQTAGAAFGDVSGGMHDLNDKYNILRPVLMGLATYFAVELPHDILIAAQWFRVLVDAILLLIPAAIGMGKVVADVLTGNLPAAVADAKATVSELSPAMKKVTDSIQTAWNTTTEDMTTKVEDFQRNFGISLDNALSANKKTTDTIKGTYQQLVEDSARKKALMIKNSQDMAEAPRKAVEAEKAATIRAINDLMQGFVNGILNWLGPVQNAAGKVASAVPTETRTRGQAHSPSLVMMEIGQDYMEGLRLGMAQVQPQLMTTVQKMSYGVFQNTQAPSSGGAGPSTLQATINVHIGNDKLATFVKEISLDQLANSFA